MNRERHRRVMELFDRACSLDTDQQASYLDEACAGDSELRRRIQRMLDHDRQATAFVEKADTPTGVEFIASSIAALGENAQQPRSIGRYVIVRKIGEGGMGVVFEATQETPKRAVALKVLRPGMASRSLLRRFEFEADVLGRLKHPGIAQIYEAGTASTPMGKQPFFAMEYIQGRQLLEYAEARELPLRTRLELFAKICDAMQFAHQVGVIHRDLKPGNILVDESEGSRGEPKILDFGVARATDADIRTVTMQTDVGQLVGTIPYMSPEQVSGDPNAVDTRSDVYALGVILFELLSHKLPYDVLHRAIPDAVRVIRDDEPTRLGSVDATLRGDVETIVAKALEKERDRRYSSAADLAADIRRYLKDEPIAARPASTLYQMRKFARRNRGLVGGLGVAFVLLIATVVQTTLERNAARLARDKARVEAARASALNTFLLDDVFGGIDPSGGATKDLTVAQLLDNATSRVEAAFAGQPEQEGVVRASLGKLYQGLGYSSKAETQLRRALEIQTATLGDESDDAQETRYILGGLLIRDSRLDEGGIIMRRRLEIQERTLSKDDPNIADTLDELGYLAYLQSRHKEAEGLHRRALAIEKRAYGNDHPSIATTLDLLANTMHGQHRLDEARAMHQECLRRWRAQSGDESLNIATALFKLGIVAMKQGDYDSAEKYYSQALDMRKRILRPLHPHIAEVLSRWCELNIRRGELDSAKSLCETAMEIQRATFNPNNLRLAKTLTRLGLIAKRKGDHARSEPLYREAAAIYDAENPKSSAAAVTSVLYALSLAAQNRCDEAVPLMRKGLRRCEAILSEDDWRLSAFRSKLGACLAKLNQDEEAERYLLEAHAGLLTSRGKEDRFTQQAVQSIIDFYVARNKHEEVKRWRLALID